MLLRGRCSIFRHLAPKLSLLLIKLCYNFGLGLAFSSHFFYGLQTKGKHLLKLYRYRNSDLKKQAKIEKKGTSYMVSKVLK